MFLEYFLKPLIFTIMLIKVLYPCALKLGFTDKPCHRKQHKTPTPIIGGIAIYIALIGTLYSSTMPLPNQNAFVLAATLLVGIGLIDDYRNLSVKIRLVAQIIAALIMTEYADIKITTLGNLFGLGEINLSAFSTVFTVFAVVGGINAFNMIDGIDGLAGCLTLISIVSIAEVSWATQMVGVLSYGLIFIGCILGFLLFNLRILGRPSAKIFLGDTGSTLFGFTVCWLAISITQSEQSHLAPITALWILGLPLIDSVCIMIRRFVKGRSPFNPDREHLHHLFTVAGYSINSTLLLIATFALILSLNGVIASQYLKVSEPVLFTAFLGLFLSYYWLMNNAWTIMKISRYLRMTSLFERRIVNQGNAFVEKRSGKDRRFKPTPKEIEEFKSGSFFYLTPLFQKQSKESQASFSSKTKEDK